MSTHPNVLLVLALTPDDLPMKTYRAILDDEGVKEDDDVKLGQINLHHGIMEQDFDMDWQLKLPARTIYFFTFVTYGYGDTIVWDGIEAQKNALEAWGIKLCQKHHCSMKIIVTANYW